MEKMLLLLLVFCSPLLLLLSSSTLPSLCTVDAAAPVATATATTATKDGRQSLFDPPEDGRRWAVNDYTYLAIYVFGDSTVDPGNNIYIPNAPAANSLPYGIDYEFGMTPTGRFTNGYTVADILASNLKLPPPPAYLGTSDATLKNDSTGINYASSGCGILLRTKPPEKNCSALGDQIYYFSVTVQNNPDLFLPFSLIFISVGANDFIFSYDGTQDAGDFARTLVEELKAYLVDLYGIGARKILVNNIGPLGCIPAFRSESGCDDKKNQLILSYNSALLEMLVSMAKEYPEAMIFHGDAHYIFSRVLEFPSYYGFQNTTGPCCGENVDGKLWCKDTTSVCPDRYAYLFFDGAHTTTAANSLFVSWCMANRLVCSKFDT